jgi:hypothetical protein
MDVLGAVMLDEKLKAETARIRPSSTIQPISVWIRAHAVHPGELQLHEAQGR